MNPKRLRASGIFVIKYAVIFFFFFRNLFA